MEWLASRGAHIYVPVGHSPDIDLIAVMDNRTLRVEVKTSNRVKGQCWQVQISTRGGNQSWSGLAKHFDPKRCDFLFVHVGDGRRWFIPTNVLDCRSGLTLGGPKYSPFEIERGRPLGEPTAVKLRGLGEYGSGQTGGAVNAMPECFAGSNPASPIVSKQETVLRPSNRERKLGRSGQAIINQKRRVTIPQSAFFPAGFQPGDRLRAR